MGKLPSTIEHPAEGIELVQLYMAETKTAMLLLKTRFSNQPDSPLLHPGIGFPSEA